MVRKYDASRRAEAANRTREAILAAAFKLHGQGIIDLESLAVEADVSLATVRKHFPTREHLYEGCTAYGLHLVTMPDLDALAATEDAVARTRLAVEQVYRLYEQLSGHIWSSYKYQDGSAVLDRVIKLMEEMLREIAGLVVQAWQPERDEGQALGFVIGMLSPLTFRALCTQGGLETEQAIASVEYALGHFLSTPDSLVRKEAAYVQASS